MTRPLAAFAVAVGLVAGRRPGRVAQGLVEQPLRLASRRADRGDALRLELRGQGRLIAPFSAEITPLNADAASWKFRINPAADTPVGVYVCRVRTDDGLSGPFLFSVGQVAQVLEVEDNSSFELAQPIPSPAVVEGKSEGNDVDYFRFSGKKGQRIVVDAQCSRIGSGVDPSIRLTTASRTYVASADDTPGLMTDARLTVVLPEDTDYVIELSDSRYQGTGKAIYRLLVGPVPVADEVFPLGGRKGRDDRSGAEGRDAAQSEHRLGDPGPQPRRRPQRFPPPPDHHTLGIAGLADPVLDVESIPPLVVDRLPELREPTEPGSATLKAFAPVVFNGRIGKRGEEDRYVVVVTPGQKLRIEVDAAELGSALDGVLRVKGPDGAVLATADDTASVEPETRPRPPPRRPRPSTRPTPCSTSPSPPAWPRSPWPSATSGARAGPATPTA